MIYRQACRLDIPQIVSLGKLYHDSIDKIPYEYDLTYVSASLLESVGKPETFFELAVDDGNLVGMLWGVATPVLPWTPTVSAIDIMFFVREDYRGTRIAMNLIKKYEAWAKEMKCTEVLLSTSSGINTHRTIRFYERIGYSLTGQQLTKDL